jgi:hypothetical protein
MRETALYPHFWRVRGLCTGSATTPLEHHVRENLRHVEIRPGDILKGVLSALLLVIVFAAAAYSG